MRLTSSFVRAILKSMPEPFLAKTERFLPLTLGRTARSTLAEFLDADVSAEDLVRILGENQVYRELFARFVQKKIRYRAPGKDEGKKADKNEKTEKGEKPVPTPTHRLIGLLGMIGSRNLLLSLRMHRAVHGSFPLGEDGSLDLRASDYLRTAQEFEDSFQRNQLDYAETAFAAGVLFDWIWLKWKDTPTAKTLETFFRETKLRALRHALIAYELSRRVPGQLPQQSLAAAIVSHAGKLLLAEASPDRYPERFRAIDADPRLDFTARLLTEREEFGYGFEEVSAHALYYFDVFRAHGAVVRYSRSPYALKDRDHGHYLQASLVLVAGELARTWRVPTGEKDPVLTELPPTALAALKLSPAALTESLRTALARR